MEFYVLVRMIFRKISDYFSNYLIFKMGTKCVVSYKLKNLPFKQQSCYLNFSALFMKSVLLRHKNVMK
jgi:hypothetical protein